MANWDDDDDDNGEIEPFDPAKSVIPQDNYFHWLDTVCKNKFIDLYCGQFPEPELDKIEFLYDLL